MKNQEIEEKARELADMVGSVAVDENLPLEVIEMTADILKEDCEQIRQAAVDIAEEERAIRLEYSTDTTKGGAAWRAAEQRSTQRYENCMLRNNPCIIGKIGRIKKSDRIGHNKENGGLRYGRI